MVSFLKMVSFYFLCAYCWCVEIQWLFACQPYTPSSCYVRLGVLTVTGKLFWVFCVHSTSSMSGAVSSFPLVPFMTLSCLVALASIPSEVLSGRGVRGYLDLPLSSGDGSPLSSADDLFPSSCFGALQAVALGSLSGLTGSMLFLHRLAGWGHGGEEHGLWAAVAACPCDGMQRLAESGRACPFCGCLIRILKECSLKDL